MDGDLVRAVGVSLEDVLLSTACGLAIAEVGELSFCDLDVATPGTLRLDLVDGQGRRHRWMEFFGAPVVSEEHEAILVRAVALALNAVFCRSLTIDKGVLKSDRDNITVTTSLQRKTLLVINAVDVVHADLSCRVVSGDAVDGVLVRREVATCVAFAVRAACLGRVDVSSSA